MLEKLKAKGWRELGDEPKDGSRFAVVIFSGTIVTDLFYGKPTIGKLAEIILRGDQNAVSDYIRFQITGWMPNEEAKKLKALEEADPKHQLLEALSQCGFWFKEYGDREKIDNEKAARYYACERYVWDTIKKCNQ